MYPEPKDGLLYSIMQKEDVNGQYHTTKASDMKQFYKGKQKNVLLEERWHTKGEMKVFVFVAAKLCLEQGEVKICCHDWLYENLTLGLGQEHQNTGLPYRVQVSCTKDYAY